MSRVRALALSGLVAAATACVGDHAGSSTSPNPLAGLYAPGSTLGASDPTDVPRPGMGLAQRCVAPFPSAAADAGTGGGTLRVDYQTQSLKGRYAPKNCTATWIETPDGRFVATLEIDAALRRPGLVYFQEHTCTQEPGPDVMTSATLRDHSKPHSVMWSGVDFLGHPVPDGPYKLFIEVTETDKEPGELSTFDFTKGPASHVDQAVDAEGPLLSVSIAWTPSEQAGAH